MRQVRFLDHAQRAVKPVVLSATDFLAEIGQVTANDGYDLPALLMRKVR